MVDPIFLTLDEVLQIHSYQIAEFGGDPAIHDLGLLESALAQPQQAFGSRYLHEDLAAMAAAYLFHIANNHSFVDGNKRTGTHAAIIFLELNGYPLEFPEETESLVLAVAAGEKTKKDVAEFFRTLISTQHNS